MYQAPKSDIKARRERTDLNSKTVVSANSIWAPTLILVVMVGAFFGLALLERLS